MGLSREWVFGALRLTFGIENTPADVDALLEAIPPLVTAARSKALAAV
jgi:cysteine sulfinate desulfinase/cysteine desulfurase-like protein